MNILFARGSIAQALREGEQAIALNPYDMTVLTGYGLRLAFAGAPPKVSRCSIAPSSSPRCVRRCSNSPSSW
jgi:hypothetical protein